MARTEEIGERCKHLIFEDRRLTLRQKQLLADLVDNPLLVVDVGMYEKRFDIAASTARADLTRLVSLNFLLTEFSAKKQVFCFAPISPACLPAALQPQLLLQARKLEAGALVGRCMIGSPVERKVQAYGQVRD